MNNIYNGDKQLVVHDAFDIHDWVNQVIYTPTNIGISFDGAETTTFFTDSESKCSCAFSIM